MAGSWETNDGALFETGTTTELYGAWDNWENVNPFICD